MDVQTLHRRRPVPALATAVFALALVVTGLYWAGFVPGVPKTLPTFVKLVAVTVVVFAVAAATWIISLVGR